MSFSFENLDVYKKSLVFVSEVENLLESTKPGKNLADQLSRAALSIPLNIAEGNGRWHAGDKRQFFWVARGSVFECVPLVEVMWVKDLISDQQKTTFRSQLTDLSKMLTRLIQAHSS